MQQIFICNKCASILKSPQREIQLTQCGHTYCFNCMSSAANRCSRCNFKQVSSIALGTSWLPSSVSQVLQDVQTQLNILDRAVTFQREQFKLFAKYLYIMEYAYQKDKSKFSLFNTKLEKQIRQYRQARHILRNMIPVILKFKPREGKKKQQNNALSIKFF